MGLTPGLRRWALSCAQHVDFDLEYHGAMALTIEVELATVNVLVPVTVTITDIVGRVRFTSARLARPSVIVG